VTIAAARNLRYSFAELVFRRGPISVLEHSGEKLGNLISVKAARPKDTYEIRMVRSVSSKSIRAGGLDRVLFALSAVRKLKTPPSIITSGCSGCWNSRRLALPYRDNYAWV